MRRQVRQGYREARGKGLSITLALMGNPKIAILDELTTVLDPQGPTATHGKEPGGAPYRAIGWRRRPSSVGRRLNALARIGLLAHATARLP